MKHEELTRDIIRAEMTVLNELKPGLDEKLYENALVIELLPRGERLALSHAAHSARIGAT